DIDVPHAGRSRRKSQQHDVRPVRRHLDGQGREDFLARAEAQGRRDLGQHVQQVRPELAVRRLQRERLRPRGRTPRSLGVRGARMKTKTKKHTNGAPSPHAGAPSGAAPIVKASTRTRVTVNRAYKMYVGGAFVRS